MNTPKDYNDLPFLKMEDVNEDRIYLTEEIKEQFLQRTLEIANYWISLEDKTKEESVKGAIFSILAMIDGCNVDIPGFILAPLTSRENQEYALKNGEKYYLLNDSERIFNDIAGSLHDRFSKLKSEKKT